VFELADLIALRQIGVEIILPVEPAHQIDLRIDAQAGTHCLRHAFLVDDRQHAGKGRVHETDLRVGRGTEIGGRTGEEFGAADDLGVYFKAAHDLPRSGAAF
jgi:hypothetical protein